jgi:acyl-CoA thioesterase FadM
MARRVWVTGVGREAGEWATRFAASGLDVRVDDSTVVAAVGALWPQAQRFGLFPAAALDRVHVGGDGPVDLVQLTGSTEPEAPTGAEGAGALLSTAVGCSPIHLVPLVEVPAGANAEDLHRFYSSIGMAPVGPEVDAAQRARLGPALVELCDGDPDALIAVMRALRPSGIGAGTAVAAHEAARYSSGAIPPWKPGDVPGAPLAIYSTPVEPDWVDYNDHMTESAYLTAAGWASDAMFRYIGDDEAYRAAGHSFYTRETHIHYLREASLHEPLRFETQLLGVDAKRVHLIHLMFHGDTGDLLCTAEQMLLHVDMNAGRSVPILANVAAALDAIAEAHRHLPIPPQVGTVMALPPKKH